MAKRKSRKTPKPTKKKKPKVPTIFDCPFCNHEKSVECKLDKMKSIGNLKCNVCETQYEAIIDTLSEPIDLYHEWLDECEKINKEKNEEVQ